MHGQRPPAWFIGDGCSFSPDGLFGHDWREACRWHDWAYRCDVDVSRWYADWCFARNLIERGCCLRWAIWYWLAVRLFGWKYWNRKRSHE